MTNEQLVARIKAGENEAENMLQLWEQNKGFIHQMAVKFRGYAEIDDLKQEGYIGLCTAVEHYEPMAGASFIHYAAFWIQQTMQRYIENYGSVVRVPVKVGNELRKYKKILSEYRKWYGKEPTDLEMQAFLDVNREELENIKKVTLVVNTRSLSEPIGGEDEDITLSDSIASDQNVEDDAIEKLDTAAMKEVIWSAVDALPENYPEVLRYRYQDRMTLKEIGESLGVAPERARQIEKSALRKLRIPSRCESFRGYYEQYIAPATIHHVGLARYNTTWTSAVEAEVLGW